MVKHVILDTDIGFDPDDLVALLLLLNCDQIALDLIVTNQDFKGVRAHLVKKVLNIVDKGNIPIVRGAESKHWFFVMEEEYDESIGTNYIEHITNILKKDEHTYYLCIGALTNVAHLLQNTTSPKDFHLVQMGGSEHRREHNFSLDLRAAQYVFSQDIRCTLIPSELTNNPQIMMSHPESPLVQRIERSTKPEFQLLLSNILNFGVPFFLHDPLASMAIIQEDIFRFEPVKVLFSEDNNRNTYQKSEKSKVRVAVEADYELFLEFVENTLRKALL